MYVFKHHPLYTSSLQPQPTVGPSTLPPSSNSKSPTVTATMLHPFGQAPATAKRRQLSVGQTIMRPA